MSNLISLSNTQFSQLLTAIRNSGGGGGGGANNDYSTEETLIGKWINGKNLYRLVIEGVSWELTTTQNWQSITITSIPNPKIETCISVRLLRTFSDGKGKELYTPLKIDAQDYNNGLYLELKGSSRTGIDNTTIDTIIIEYTKSTDNLEG